MFKRSINHILRNGLPWLLVGILGATLWLSTGLAGAAPALKRLLQLGGPPQLINYQGIVKQSGAPFDGSGPFSFAIYDAATGGTQLWTSGSVNLTVTDGLFNVMLGDTSQGQNALDSSIFADNSQSYLEVTFDSEILTPRQQLVSVPYALRAEYSQKLIADSSTVCNSTAVGTIRYNSILDVAELCNGTVWERILAEPPELILYEGDSVNSGSFGGRSGADNICATSSKRPSGLFASFRAFISVDANDEIRDMPSNYSVPTNLPIKSKSGATLANNWADLLDGNIPQPLIFAGVFPDSGSEPPNYWWSGSNTDGSLLNDSTCSGWTAAGGTGRVGQENETGSRWISAGDPDCGSNLGAVLCLAY